MEYLDCNGAFMRASAEGGGTELALEFMPDQLHPNAAGELVAAANGTAPQ